VSDQNVQGFAMPVSPDVIRSLLGPATAAVQLPSSIQAVFTYLDMCRVVTEPTYHTEYEQTVGAEAGHSEVKVFPGRKLEDLEAKAKMQALILLREYFSYCLPDSVQKRASEGQGPLPTVLVVSEREANESGMDVKESLRTGRVVIREPV
jgi:hypothetical protein